MNDPKEKICQQIKLLAEISQREDTSISMIIECSLAIAQLYKALLTI